MTSDDYDDLTQPIQTIASTRRPKGDGHRERASGKCAIGNRTAIAAWPGEAGDLRKRFLHWGLPPLVGGGTDARPSRRERVRIRQAELRQPSATASVGWCTRPARASAAERFMHRADARVGQIALSDQDGRGDLVAVVV